MINAEQARETIAKIDWKTRLLDHIGRNIESLAESGYTQYEHRFNSVIPEKDIKKVIKELQDLGYFICQIQKDQSYYTISWKEATNI